jgi:hypothetical protein
MIEKGFRGEQGIFVIARHLLEILVVCLCRHSVKVEIVFIHIGCSFLFHVYALVHLFDIEKNTLRVAACCLFVFYLNITGFIIKCIKGSVLLNIFYCWW